MLGEFNKKIFKLPKTNINFKMKNRFKTRSKLTPLSIEPIMGGLNRPNFSFSKNIFNNPFNTQTTNLINKDNISNNRIKQYKLAGKLVIVESRLPIKKKVITQVYNKIPDDTRIPIVFETKKQYLTEYINNQEKKKGIKFSPQEKKQYIKNELKEYKPILARYTTKHNPYMPPRVVYFTDNKFTPKEFKATAWHEYGHEEYEKKLQQHKLDKVSRDKEEAYADNVMYKYMEKDLTSKNFVDDNIMFNEQKQETVEEDTLIQNIPIQEIRPIEGKEISLYYVGNIRPKQYLDMNGLVYCYSSEEYAKQFREQNNFSMIWQVVTNNYELDKQVNMRNGSLYISDNQYKCYNILSEQQLKVK